MNCPILRPLLVELEKLEGALHEQKSILVRPFVSGMTFTPSIAIPGYDHHQIDMALRWLATRGYIDTGDAALDALSIGIRFGGITPDGRRFFAALT